MPRLSLAFFSDINQFRRCPAQASEAAITTGVLSPCAPASPRILLYITGRWDERLTALAAGIRDTAHRHPAVLPLLLTRPAITPAARAVRDTVQSALREGGLPGRY